MPLSVDAHHFMLDALADDTYGGADEVALITATALTAATDGTADVTLDRVVGVGDSISLNDGANPQEVFRVTAVNGNTATLHTTPTNSYGANTPVGHAPLVSADVVEPGGATTRQAILWQTATGEKLSISGDATFDVDGGVSIGGFALYNVTSGVFFGSFLTNGIESFGAQGTYQLTQADVNLDQQLPQ